MRYVVQVYAAVDPEDSESGDSKALALNWVWLLISFTELCTMPARTQWPTVLSEPVADEFQDLAPGAWPHDKGHPNFHFMVGRSR